MGAFVDPEVVQAPDVSIDAFQQDLQTELKVFVENWLEENGRDPEGWPLKMPLGEWWEQFLSSQCG